MVSEQGSLAKTTCSWTRKKLHEVYGHLAILEFIGATKKIKLLTPLAIIGAIHSQW